MNFSTPKSRKERGEWAELVFAARASAEGLIVARPYGDSAPFDAIVVAQSRISRVQVKSSWTPDRYAGYEIRSCSSRGAYTTSEIDFLAVYIGPEDVWYIIPARALTNAKISIFFPLNAESKGQYEPFREAWHLLSEPPGHRAEDPSSDSAPASSENKGFKSSITKSSIINSPDKSSITRSPDSDRHFASSPDRDLARRRFLAAWRTLGDYLIFRN